MSETKKTSAEWWAEVKADPEKLRDWLHKQYVGEITAYNRMFDFLKAYGAQAKDPKWVKTVEEIAWQEAAHSVWVGQLLVDRGGIPGSAESGMGLFTIAVNRRIRKAGIAVRDKAHYDELYIKFRDEIYLERRGVTYAQWQRLRQKLDAYTDHLLQGESKLRFRDYAFLSGLVLLLAGPVLIFCCGVIAVNILQPRNT